MAANFLKSLFGEEDVDEQDSLYETNEQTLTSADTNNKVVSINSGRPSQMSQISLYEPRPYADVKQIAFQLLEGRMVVVSFTQMDINVAARLVDFLNGTVFATDGETKRIGKKVFLCTPKNYEISDSLTNNLKNDDGKFWSLKGVNMIASLLWALNQLADVYISVIVVWCIMLWLPNARNSRSGDIIDRSVEPYMHWFDFTPPIGGISFAPIIAILVLYFVRAGLTQVVVIIWLILRGSKFKRR